MTPGQRDPRPTDIGMPPGLHDSLLAAEKHLRRVLEGVQDGAGDALTDVHRARCHEVADRILDLADCLATALLPYAAAAAS